jgi:hypothetical protein
MPALPAAALRYSRAMNGTRLATVLLLATLAVVYAGLIAYTVHVEAAEDETVYYLAGRLVWQGQDPYSVDRASWDRLAIDEGLTNYQWPYRYPPLTAVLFVPFLVLGAQGATIAFAVVSAAALVGGAVLIGAALGGGRHTVAALALLLACGPAYLTIYVGQINGLLFLAVAAAFWGLMRRHDWWLASGLAVGTALKVLPAALVAWLFWARRWRQAILTLGVLAAVLAGCLAAVGPATMGRYATKAYELSEPDVVRDSPGIDTVTAFVGRLTLPWPGSTAPGTVRDVRLAATLVTLVLVAATAVATWPRSGRVATAVAATGRPGPAAFEFAAVLALTLVVGPFTFYHQFVALLIPLLLVGERLWRRRTAAARTALAVLLTLYVLVDVQQIVWMAARDRVLATGLWRGFTLPFVLTIVLWAACCLIARSDKRRLTGNGGDMVPEGTTAVD